MARARCGARTQPAQGRRARAAKASRRERDPHHGRSAQHRRRDHSLRRVGLRGRRGERSGDGGRPLQRPISRRLFHEGRAGVRAVGRRRAESARQHVCAPARPAGDRGRDARRRAGGGSLVADARRARPAAVGRGAATDARARRGGRPTGGDPPRRHPRLAATTGSRRRAGPRDRELRARAGGVAGVGRISRSTRGKVQGQLHTDGRHREQRAGGRPHDRRAAVGTGAQERPEMARRPLARRSRFSRRGGHGCRRRHRQCTRTPSRATEEGPHRMSSPCFHFASLARIRRCGICARG